MTQPPPAAPAPAVPQGASGPRATFGQRFVAAIIDTILIVIVAAVLVGIGAAIDESLAIIMYLIVIVVAWGYYVYFEGGPTGQTLGKKAMNIRVISFDTGGEVGYGKAFVRQLVRSFISGAICFLGYFWMLWDKEKQTWHDKIASTVVVPTSAYPIS
jgi:uncharacterized RDD family membrane protein YckC